VDEMMFAGFLRRRPVEMTKCLTVDLWVPASSEIVLEGYVLPGEERIEGPFGDHTGYYSPADPYPVFHVTAVTHRKAPLYFATVVGIPPMEDEWLGWATERLFLPLLRTQWPEVAEMHLPVEGVFHNLCLASIRKHYPMQARRLMSGFWGAGQMSFTKIVAVLDEADPVRDAAAAARILLDRVRIPEDLFFTEGVLDALDHASPHPLWGGKMGIDATTKIAGEPGHGVSHPTGSPSVTEEGVYSDLSPGFPGLRRVVIPLRGTRLTLALLVFAKTAPGEGMRLARAAAALPGVDVAVTVEGNGGEPLRLLAWRALSSVDPGRDVSVVGRKLAVDATSKAAAEGHPRSWPAEVEHPPEVVEKVSRIAVELGLVP
jgi:4-hydroxy-3-polyprenylbenzoate decarboxylase